MNEKEQRRQYPAYILSSMRSGSTLLRRLLNAHPRLCCPPETKFLLSLTDLMKSPQIANALLSLGVSSSQLFSCFRAFTCSILDDHAAKQGKVRWIDKTPSYHQIVDVIDEMFDREVLFIVLLRHPLDCIVSLEEFIDEAVIREDHEIAGLVEKHGGSLHAWALYWRTVYGNLLDGAARRGDRQITIRYEDLVCKTDCELGRALRFLGESSAPDLTSAAFASPLAPGYSDQKIVHTNRVHRDSVGRCRALSDGDRDGLWREVEEIASQFEYSREPPRG